MISELLAKFWEKLTTDVGFLVIVLISIAAITVLYFYVMKFLSEHKSKQVIVIMVFVIVISGCVFAMNENLDKALFLLVPFAMVILIGCIYAVEFKRLIWTRSNMKLVESKHNSQYFVDEEKIKGCISEIIKALQDMSKSDIGAIIVLSNGDVPAQILESGVSLDSNISSELIESVFLPKTPLHDGAMIINGTKIVAAGCLLPLSQQVEGIPKDLGTRHRAGIGVTENIDVVSLMVSEETGIISVAKAGKITRYADTELLRKTLTKYYWQDIDARK